MPTRTAHRGLTLVEFTLVLAVAALLLGLAAPPFNAMVERQRTVAASNRIVAHLNRARLHAVHRREIAIVCPSDDGQRCSAGNRWDAGWIVFRDPDRDGQPGAPADVLQVAPPIVRLHADSAGRTRVRYRPDGTAGGTNLTIKLCPAHPDAPPRAVIVSNPGRPRVDDLPDHLACPDPGG
ncbi:MAG: GspH/FimT family pseudopilin [Wenzhouxiangellaceae bacterium]|nr:GspH/FimT family pseudopilin [Wenzhouxiangellaceae bacterium]